MTSKPLYVSFRRSDEGRRSPIVKEERSKTRVIPHEGVRLAVCNQCNSTISTIIEYRTLVAHTGERCFHFKSEELVSRRGIVNTFYATWEGLWSESFSEFRIPAMAASMLLRGMTLFLKQGRYGYGAHLQSTLASVEVLGLC